ncbi:MAG TPA: hypothetical protein VJY36_02240 [Candidatus Bathyarchaeia archaeon]|nr:hypothetical protein [Candidatus Bathyarchaeia archaeon]
MGKSGPTHPLSVRAYKLGMKMSVHHSREKVLNPLEYRKGSFNPWLKLIKNNLILEF